ncbi:F510_1955 family glycosylhydrolase [Neobacillus vireti]|uniref:F510_1955 family glycosylhydrolase n=1 Tax=Neobacillus vireti TaxID=220686 RepID=UPI002FFEDFF5
MKLNSKTFLAFFLGVLLITSGCSNQSQEKKETSSKNKTPFHIVEAGVIKLKNIRGIGYPGNDTALYIAASDGLKFYKDKKWYKTTANQHDYIGFQTIKTGFIASGHPQKGSSLDDPLGLVRSVNKGKTLQKLAFYDKANFHFTAASYAGNGLYVIGEEQSSSVNLGVNYSTDNGKTWKKSAFKNFSADSMGMMAVHPTNGNTMAMSTRSGIFFSTDNGNTMKLITGPIMVTALTFSGDSILFSSVEEEKILLKTISPLTGEQVNLIIPFLDYDNPITYLAVNPKNTTQIAFTTYKNDLYESTDGGKTWNNLLKDGKNK